MSDLPKGVKEVESVGSGITKKRRFRFDRTAEGWAALIEFIESQQERHPLDRWLDDREAFEAKELREHSLPEREGIWRKEGEAWIEHRPGDPSPPNRPDGKPVNLVSVVLRAGHADNSRPGFAARILRQVKHVRAAIDAGKLSKSSALDAIELGMLVTERRMKVAHEKDALRSKDATRVIVAEGPKKTALAQRNGGTYRAIADEQCPGWRKGPRRGRNGVLEKTAEAVRAKLSPDEDGKLPSIKTIKRGLRLNDRK